MEGSHEEEKGRGYKNGIYKQTSKIKSHLRGGMKIYYSRIFLKYTHNKEDGPNWTSMTK